MATVTFDHVYKRYGDVTAVADFNLEIEDGEFMVLVGPSGCGKTTSLRMIAGLEEISEGELRIGDKVVNDVAPKDRDIAMVFQSYALYPHMSVRDNLAFGLKLRKVPKADIEKRINEAAGILQLEKLLDRKPKELSGGQRQRVALGRAIVREPAVFLMDEPLSNLDAKLRVQTRAEIARLHQRLGTTMVYVTHDQVEAMTMGQRIAVMSEGLLQQVGTPQALYDTPKNRFVAGFIGSPSMNFMELPLVDEGANLGRGSVSFGLPDEWRKAVRDAGDTVVAGFRPEHLDLGDIAGPFGTVQGTADVVEYLGNEELLHVSVNDSDIVAIVDSAYRVQPGDTVTLKMPLGKLQLFATDDNGDALAAPRRRGGLTRARTSATTTAGSSTRAGRPFHVHGAPMTEPRITRLDPQPFGDDPLEEHVAARELVHRGRYLEFRVDTIVRADGTTGTRDVVGHPGAIAVLAVDDDGRLLLVRQWRIPAERGMLEIPAGTLDVHDGVTEDPDLAARRELEEETGQRATTWRKLATFWTAPGFATELMHLYLATGLSGADRDGPPHPRRGRAPGAQPRGDRRTPWPWSRPARSATRRRSSASSGWTASRGPARSEQKRSAPAAGRGASTSGRRRRRLRLGAPTSWS